MIKNFIAYFLIALEFYKIDPLEIISDYLKVYQKIIFYKTFYKNYKRNIFLLFVFLNYISVF